MILVTVYIMLNFWEQSHDWWSGISTYYIILGISGIVLSLWIALDGKRLTNYAKKLKTLEKNLADLEKKIKLIKS